MTKFPALDRKLRLVVAGQSMNFIPGDPFTVPARVRTATGLPMVNIAHGGYGWVALLAEPAYLAELEDAAAEDFVDILVMNGGTSDWLFLGLSAVECYEAFADYIAAYDAAKPATKRRYVVGVTLPGADDAFYGVPTAAQQVIWADLNAMLVDDPDGLFDAIAQCHTAPLADATSTTYFSVDQLHLSQRGGSVMDSRITAAVLTLPPFV